MQIDLNADLGEGIGDDEALLSLVTSANIATGAHAGGGEVLERAVAAAAERGVAIGAHPSYRDPQSFGRTSHLASLVDDAAARSRIVADLVDQVVAVARAAHRHGRELTHIKAHGALYNDAARHDTAAAVVLEAVERARAVLGYPVAVVSQPGGRLAHHAGRRAIPVVAEGFADRGYDHDGALVPRDHPRAVHEDVDRMVEQALGLARGAVATVHGTPIPVAVQSLCVHGDTPGAVAAAGAIRSALEAAGWRVTRQAAAGDVVGPGVPTVAPFGDRALLIEAPVTSGVPTDWVVEVAAQARRQWPGATVVPGLASVLVSFARPSERPGPASVQVDALGLQPRAAGGDGDGSRAHAAAGPATHLLPTRYDGDDLADLAQVLGVDVGSLVRRHAAAPWTVAAVGFAPGFGYLTSPDPLFRAIPRRADPRRRVPRGAVALAAGMCAVYPSATPGGWQLIGSTSVELLDLASPRPARLRVGDRVRFLPEP